MTQMNDGHRLFLQSFMSRGILNAKEVKQLFKICCLKYKSTFLIINQLYHAYNDVIWVYLYAIYRILLSLYFIWILYAIV